MSLKAKLEAVIYAAEEPVTLAQLAVLFAGEALEWKAARDAEQAPALPLPEEAAAEAAAESLASPTESASELEEEEPELASVQAEVPETPEAVSAESSEAAKSSPAGTSSETEQESDTEPTRAESSPEDLSPSKPVEPPTEEFAAFNAADQLPESAVDAPEAHHELEASVSEESVKDETNAKDETEESADETEAVSEASVGTTSIAPFAVSADDLEAEPETAAGAAEESSDDTATATATDSPVKQTDPNSKLAAVVSAEEAEFEARRQERRRDREARETLRAILAELIAEYAADTRGIEIREIAGGYRMGTKPEMHDAVRAFVKSLKPALKLSLPALETLAVIAYKQPVTAPEVGEIRGVDSAGVLGSLMSRKLIATAGRKQVVGRPMLYKTTKEFLLRFGLKDVSELPSMEEFEKMAAQELSEDIADEATAQTGDLFAESESATVPAAGASEEEPETVAIAETTESESSEIAISETETRETESKEAAESEDEPAAASTEAQAPQTTENQATGATPDAEEIEA